MAHSLKEELIVPPEETGAIGGTPSEVICRKLPDGTLIRCLGEFVEQGICFIYFLYFGRGRGSMSVNGGASF